ncbi:MAG: hypothetical protein ACRD5L_09370, partial [Bryobacteraceae bacterium]
MVLAAIFYLEEDSRGKGAWENCRTTLRARHESVDWADYIPPAVPDASNFFKAPKMQEWFGTSGPNDLTARMSLQNFPDYARLAGNHGGNVVIAELFLRLPGAEAASSEPIDSIKFDDVPLADAIKTLALRTGVEIKIDPQIGAGPSAQKVNAHWTNTTAYSVLMALVSANNLGWSYDPQTGAAQISASDADAASATPRQTSLQQIWGGVGPITLAAGGFTCSARVFDGQPPVRLSVAPDGIPHQRELARFFPGITIEPGSNSLSICVAPAPISAASYLAWSGAFTPDLDAIGEALNRPFARLDGDYDGHAAIPTANVDTVR